MRKGIILLAGFLLAFSIFLVGCGDGESDIQVTDTNDKSNFKKPKLEDYTAEDFEPYYASTGKLFTQIIGFMSHNDLHGVRDANAELTRQLKEINTKVKNKCIDPEFKINLSEYLNNLESFNECVASAKYSAVPQISYDIGTSLKKLANSSYNDVLPPAVEAFATGEENTEINDKVVANAAVGDTQTVDGVTIKLISITKTSERNKFDESNPKDVIKITYNIENNSAVEVVAGMDIEAYDSNNTMLDRYPLDNTMEDVPPGKNVNAENHYGINTNGKIEIQFMKIALPDNPIIFTADIK
ncbi:hypothetical protein ACXA0J_000296 [Listeria monocytogenes]